MGGPPGAEDGSLTALRAACRAVGYVPRIRFEMPSGAGRQLIAAGKAVQLVEPTSQGGPGVAVRPLAGAPMRMRLVFAWRRERLTWEQTNRVFAEIAGAYATQALQSQSFRSWWEANAGRPSPRRGEPRGPEFLGRTRISLG